MKNRTLGSIFIIAGAAIGGGMLAMPIATVGIGFSVTALLLLLIWLLVCYTGLLLVEAHQHVKLNTGLGSLARHYFGHYGQQLTTGALLFLLYALTTLYISGAASLITARLTAWTQQPVQPVFGVLLFTVIAGSVVCIGTHSVDLFTRLLFSLKLFALALAVVIMLPYVELTNLVTMPREPAGLIFSALPVILLSFGFHPNVSGMVNYLGGDIRKCRVIVIIGSAIPLIVYLLWQLVTLGVIPRDIFATILTKDSGANGLLQAMQKSAASPAVHLAMILFTTLALLTSFLAVALGLFDYLADIFKRGNSFGQRLQTGLLTFLPPLIFALFYPNGFMLALRFAAYPGITLAIILPVLLTWKARQRYPDNYYKDNYYKVAGGTPALLVALCCGIGFIGITLASTLGYLPA